MKTIEEINQHNVKKILSEKKIPEFYPGDVVKVGVRITEGKKDRIQYFEGVCIAKKSRDLNSSFTVRKISFGEGVERTFPLYGTLIDSIKVIRSGKVRRAKLYYLRDRTGKSARITEGKKDRIQYFEGVCIAKKSRDLNSSFTVRKISFGEGVERTFPLYGTLIDSIKVIRSGKVRRAKLYYLRDRTGKSARIAEKIRKKIGIDVDIKPETVTEENLAPVVEVPTKETAPIADAVPAVEEKKEEPKLENTLENK